MFRFFVILSLFVSSLAYANPEKCQKNVAAQVREKYGSITIESIDFGGSYTAGTVVESNGSTVSFNNSGYIYWVGLNAFGSEGLDVFLVDEKCRHLDDVNVFGEE